MNGFYCVLYFFSRSYWTLIAFLVFSFFYLEIQIVYNFSYYVWSSIKRGKFSGFSFFNRWVENKQFFKFIARSKPTLVILGLLVFLFDILIFSHQLMRFLLFLFHCENIVAWCCIYCGLWCAIDAVYRK